MNIFYPGVEGSYAYCICTSEYESYQPIKCSSPENAIRQFQNSSKSEGNLLAIPIENSIGGKVIDIHNLIPSLYECSIKAEHYFKVSHCLVGPPGAKLEDVTEVHSHIQALRQCSRFIEIHAFAENEAANTAVAAKRIAEFNEKSKAAIASREAAHFFDLDIIVENIQNSLDANFTRFIVFGNDTRAQLKFESDRKYLSFIFYKTRNASSCLFRTLVGFATSQINVVKLESFIDQPGASDARFYLEIEGHPNDFPVMQALDDLRRFSTEMRVMGVIERAFE